MKFVVLTCPGCVTGAYSSPSQILAVCNGSSSSPVTFCRMVETRAWSVSGMYRKGTFALILRMLPSCGALVEAKVLCSRWLPVDFGICQVTCMCGKHGITLCSSSTSSLSIRDAQLSDFEFLCGTELVVCSFQDGSVGVFNYKHKKMDFMTQPSHTETIFNCAFSAVEPNCLFYSVPLSVYFCEFMCVFFGFCEALFVCVCVFVFVNLYVCVCVCFCVFVCVYFPWHSP